VEPEVQGAAILEWAKDRTSKLQAKEAVMEGPKEQTRITTQSMRHRHRTIDEIDPSLNLPPRIHATGSITSTNLSFLVPIPLAVNVNTASGKDTLSCVKLPTLACKTIRYALAKGQLEALKQGRLLLLIKVASGEYLGDCLQEGTVVTMAVTVKKAGEREVLVDCKGAGSLLNITQGASSISRLEGLTIANGVSKHGGAVSIGGGRLLLKDCVFRDITSLASHADGNFVGGGAVSFVVSV
jgi:hypothetical protein